MDADFPRPALTVDVVVFATPDADGLPSTGALSVLLVQRAHEPFKDGWALPGGFVEQGERVAAAAPRELEEETGLATETHELLGVYDTPGRDPRGWTVSVVYVAVLASRSPVAGADDARDARWFSVDALPELAFDHATIVADALQWYADRSG
jgi:8-oxo-dGTP diphosphatase